MDDRKDGRDDRQGGERQGGRGPQGTEFLDLEISRVIFENARQLARDVALEIVRDAMRERLEQRLGDRLAAAGRLAADELADDIEANLEIEQRIDTRRAERQSLDARIREVFAGGERRGPRAPSRRKR